MPESQYIEPYLEFNRTRGEGNGFTIGTFLAYNLQGKAHSYWQGYVTGLQRACERRVTQGKAKLGISVHGFNAYYPTGEDHD